ncbi:MAG: peptidase M23 [Saprospiraceae bacterium]|nr:MAG: peptidase M23 [Saprospiraceae bacterium]
MREDLQHTYRLVVMNNETFEEVRSFQLSLLNVYISISSVVVVVAALVVMAIAFTPIRKYIPGYGDALQDEAIIEAYQQINKLEKELDAQEAYTENFRKVLVGDVQTESDIPKVDPQSLVDSLEDVPMSAEESQLIDELELEELGVVAQQPRKNALLNNDVPLEQLYFISPLHGEISAGFMPEKDHNGVDILAPKNTAIKAASDGYVFLSDWTLETGNTIGILHANNTATFYKHNSVLLKKAGSYVKAGEGVAIIGNTGTLSSGPHLHFELWYEGKPVDPTEYMDF